MEPGLYWLLIIAFGILQIILLVKFFQIASDLRVLKDHFTKIKLPRYSVPSTEEIPTYEITDKTNGRTVKKEILFRDGEKGCIVLYPGYNEVGFEEKGSKECIYTDEKSAILGLYYYLKRDYRTEYNLVAVRGKQWQ